MLPSHRDLTKMDLTGSISSVIGQLTALSFLCEQFPVSVFQRITDDLFLF
jgi:hypothetical protein